MTLVLNGGWAPSFGGFKLPKIEVIHRFQVYIRYPYAPWDWNLSLQYISAIHVGKKLPVP